MTYITDSTDAITSYGGWLGDDGLPAGVVAELAAGDPVGRLIMQVNRFPGIKYPIATGTLTIGPAMKAVNILIMRAQDAAIAGVGDSALFQQLGDANKGGQQVAWVTARLPEVTRTIQLYGDAKGYPQPGALTIAGIPVSRIAMVAGAGALLWFVALRGKRKARR